MSYGDETLRPSVDVAHRLRRKSFQDSTLENADAIGAACPCAEPLWMEVGLPRFEPDAADDYGGGRKRLATAGRRIVRRLHRRESGTMGARTLVRARASARSKLGTSWEHLP